MEKNRKELEIIIIIEISSITYVFIMTLCNINVFIRVKGSKIRSIMREVENKLNNKNRHCRHQDYLN